MKLESPPYILELARQFRANPTPAEKALWQHLRTKRLAVGNSTVNTRSTATSPISTVRRRGWSWNWTAEHMTGKGRWSMMVSVTAI